MDSTTFDTVTRNLSTAVTRRSALRGLVAGALAVTVGSSALETSARRRRKSKQHRRHDDVVYLQPGDPCETNKQCGFDGERYICAEVGLSSDRVCCGAENGLCDRSGTKGSFCCNGYRCANGLCIAV